MMDEMAKLLDAQLRKMSNGVSEGISSAVFSSSAVGDGCKKSAEVLAASAVTGAPLPAVVSPLSAPALLTTFPLTTFPSPVPVTHHSSRLTGRTVAM